MIRLFSGCTTQITNTVSAATIDFTVSKLKVTYDALNTEPDKNPQVKLFYGSDYVGVRLPTVNIKVIKWGWHHTDNVSSDDHSLTASETWTFEVSSTGTVTLTSPRGISYSWSVNTDVAGFHGGTMTLGFDNFKLDGGVSCYEIISPNPLNPGKI